MKPTAIRHPFPSQAKRYRPRRLSSAARPSRHSRSKEPPPPPPPPLLEPPPDDAPPLDELLDELLLLELLLLEEPPLLELLLLDELLLDELLLEEPPAVVTCQVSVVLWTVMEQLDSPDAVVDDIILATSCALLPTRTVFFENGPAFTLTSQPTMDMRVKLSIPVSVTVFDRIIVPGATPF